MPYRIAFVSLLAIVVALTGCGELEGRYYQGGVNQATEESVAKHYGAPHSHERMPDGRSIWTYYDRGSGTSGYSGFARASYCQAYILTFDQNEILRDWRQRDCSSRPARITEPFSDRK